VKAAIYSWSLAAKGVWIAVPVTLAAIVWTGTTLRQTAERHFDGVVTTATVLQVKDEVKPNYLVEFTVNGHPYRAWSGVDKRVHSEYVGARFPVSYERGHPSNWSSAVTSRRTSRCCGFHSALV